MATVDIATIASDATCVFAFDDDFSISVLQSRPHVAWAWHQSSTLEVRLRYTPTSVMMTFPWPDAADARQRDAAAEAGRRMLERRAQICVAEDIGLTELYNAVDDGAYADLAQLHRHLDEAVADCYGWPRSAAHDDAAIVGRLLELNRQISAGECDYHPFTDA